MFKRRRNFPGLTVWLGLLQESRGRLNFRFWTGLLVSLFVIITSVGISEAGSPWRWRLSLTGAQSGVAMQMPSAVYVDETKERYYVVDSGNNRLLSYDYEGEFLNSFDAGGRLELPYDMIRDSKERIWVVEKGRNSLTMIDLQAKEVKPHSLQDQGQVVYPDRLEAVGDTLLVLDKGTGRILQLDKDLQVTRRFSCDGCGAGFLDFVVNGNQLWALSQKQDAVYRFSLKEEGKPTVLRLGGENFFATSLAVGPAGRLYVLDRHESNVVVFDDAGHFKYRFLAKGQARGRLSFPTELLFDSRGNLCVVDEGNGRVQIFSRQ